MKLVVEHYVTIRGFSFASSIMEKINACSNQKVVQKSSGLRKKINVSLYHHSHSYSVASYQCYMVYNTIPSIEIGSGDASGDGEISSATKSLYIVISFLASFVGAHCPQSSTVGEVNPLQFPFTGPRHRDPIARVFLQKVKTFGFSLTQLTNTAPLSLDSKKLFQRIL